MDLFIYTEIKMSSSELSAFEKNNIASFDLLSLDVSEISRRTALSSSAIERITRALRQYAKPAPARTALDIYRAQRFLTTGDANIDELLGGGIPVSHVTEFVGESGVGKSQIMTQLCITTQLPTNLGGLAREVVYISTESGLPTTRAREISEGLRKKWGAASIPQRAMDRIHVVVCPDLELQDHMIYYQLPALLNQRQGKIGTLIIDSIAANYRAEHERTTSTPSTSTTNAAAAGERTRVGDMALRSRELARLSTHLRYLATTHTIAVVVTNQVSDRIASGHVDSVMSLDYQSRWFNGWQANEWAAKVPALGLVWANAVHVRVSLKKERGYGESGARGDAGSEAGAGRGVESGRRIGVVYSPFARPGEIGYRIGVDGVSSC